MATFNSSFQNYNAWSRYKNPTTITWGSNANACTITDPNIHPNSQVDFWVTGSTPQSGQWAIAISQGQAVITSSNSEQSTLPISYLIF